jgi:probable HAF family extracellular repeat protein
MWHELATRLTKSAEPEIRTKGIGRYKGSVAHRPAVLALAAVVSVGMATGASLALATAGAAKRPWVIRDLGTLDGLDSTPVAINDHGEVAGYGYGRDVAGRAFLWKNGRLTDLATKSMRSCGNTAR